MGRGRSGSRASSPKGFRTQVARAHQIIKNRKATAAKIGGQVAAAKAKGKGSSMKRLSGADAKALAGARAAKSPTKAQREMKQAGEARKAMQRIARRVKG